MPGTRSAADVTVARRPTVLSRLLVDAKLIE